MLDRVYIRAVLLLFAALALGQCLAGCGSPKPGSPVISRAWVAVPQIELDVAAEPMQAHVAMAPESASAPANPGPDPRVRMCEPVEPAVCRTAADCPAAPDSSAQACVTPWWSDGQTQVCSPRFPDHASRERQVDRLRVVAEVVCDGVRGCSPADLTRWLRVLALRESSLRPWKRHRLGPDREASERALAKMRAQGLYSESPHGGDPARWMAGAGLYGMLPAYWVLRLDEHAPPEALCDDVTATLLLVRAARDAVGRLERGMDCDRDGTDDWYGTGDGGPSWYDASRVLSGNLCAGSAGHRAQWRRRFGGAAFMRVRPETFGRRIDAEQHAAVDAEVRQRLEQAGL